MWGKTVFGIESWLAFGVVAAVVIGLALVLILFIYWILNTLLIKVGNPFHD